MRRFAGLLLLAGWVCPVSAAEIDRSWYDPYFDKQWILTADTDEVLVLFKESTTASDREAVALAAGLTEVQPFDSESRTTLYQTAGSAEEVAEAVSIRNEVVGATPAVRDAEGFVKYYVADQLTVQFQSDLSDAECRDRIAAHSSVVLQDYWTPGYYKIWVPLGQELFSELRAWNLRPDVQFVEPVYMCYDDALHVPNDPLYPNQWGMDNPGTGPWLETADVRATEVWEITKGDPDILIVIIDTGLDMVHEDLASQVIPRNGDDWDFSSAGSSVPDDTGDHGTACAGIAVGIQDNSKGVSGACPECSLMPLKINLSSGQNANRADAINYAASRRDEFNGLIMSCSWRMSSGDFTAVQAAVQNAWNSGCVLCVSSGNANIPIIDYPARYPECIAVGATSPCDERKSPTSCDGENFWGSSYGPEQEVMAPGVLITTTDRSGPSGYDPGNYTSSFNGTSSACPLAAGVAGLIWSANPSLTNQQVREALRENADDQVGPPNEDFPGWDQYFGYGRVNALRAVEAVSAQDSFDEDLESAQSGFDTDAVTEGWLDAWHLSDLRNHTVGGQFSMHCGSVDGSNYPGRINAALITPRVVVQEGANLSFWHYMDAEANGDLALDGGVVEITVDSGESWSFLTPVGGYTHTWSPLTQVPFEPGDAVFSGHSDWRRDFVDLSAFEGQTVQVRFRFGTRGLIFPGGGGEGWYIDDVLIDVQPVTSVGDSPILASGLQLRGAQPNPFRDATEIHFALSEASSVRFELADVSGRVVRSEDLGRLQSGEHAILLETGPDRPLPSGVYYARVHTGSEVASRQVVLLP